MVQFLVLVFLLALSSLIVSIVSIQSEAPVASVFSGSTATENGRAGLVPQPQTGDENKVLSGAGTWIVGIAGPQGPTGPQGPQGETGPQGPSGSSGSGSVKFLDSNAPLLTSFAIENADDTSKIMQFDASNISAATTRIFVAPDTAGLLPGTVTGGTLMLGNVEYSGLTGVKNTLIGTGAGSSLTLGVENTLIGNQVGAGMTTANNNVGLGSNVFGSVVTGSDNIGIGRNALQNNTANQNLAIGSAALSANTEGTSNVGIGHQALTTNSAGNNNTAIGHSGLLSNTIGSGNTAVGYRALYANFDVNNNTAVGCQALTTNEIGTSNTAIGYQALFSNLTNDNNVAIGYQTLYNNDGFQNTACGVQAMYTNTGGSGNVAFGYQALYFSQGSNNIAVGMAALYTNTSGSDNVSVGTNALYTNSIGNNNIAIGYFALQLTISDNNVAVGKECLKGNTSGTGNVGIGNLAGQTLSTGNNNVIIGYQADVAAAYTGCVVLGASVTATASNQTRIGTGTTTCFISGIRGVTTAVNNAVAVLIDGSGQLGTVNSSQRVKQDITPLTMETKNALYNIEPVSFRYKAYPSGAPQYGFIAEQVAEVFPDIVVYNDQKECETVQYHVLPPLLLALIQDLQTAFTNYKTSTDQRIADMQNEINLLKQQQIGV